ncbi:long-chain fatty acid transport protein [Cetobacterium ceti]|uniref:Long-chain fatty acid transport protein n=1 Tax=Cetobacterium ceti TaxID=180163 RepID=A0A1T4NXX2_9FUSO|nr:outer membrane protein transport protein [Cetobacterium ceti]SJZ83897.1 long-chain fatty acid transport protein [Cetobacterium ceti]
MRKQLLLAAILLTSIKGFAGSIDYLSQQDAEYFAHPSMTGKIGVSGAYYNPAGTAFMEDGTYMQVNNQTHFKTYKMKVDGETFKSDKPSPIIPSIQIVKVDNGRSYFFHGGAIAGGGNVAYEGGLGMFKVMENMLNEGLNKQAIEIAKKTKQNLNLPSNFKPIQFTGGNTVKGSSYYVTLQGGVAQKINDHWSAAFALRYVNAERKLKGVGNYSLTAPNYDKNFNMIGITHANPRFDINSERTAQGVNGIFGLNYNNDKLNVGLRYETETRLNFKTKEKNLKSFASSFGNTNPIIAAGIIDKITNNQNVKEWTNGAKGKRNLPAMASIGASYAITEKTTLLTSGNYYFIKEAGDSFGAYDGYHNGYEVAFGIDHKLNEKWTLMGGYQYTNTGANKHTYKDTDYALDADMFGLGVKYQYSPNLSLMATGATVVYHSATSVTNVTYSKHVYSMGLGATYKFN